METTLNTVSTISTISVFSSVYLFTDKVIKIWNDKQD
jgi:hypothetical protein